MKLSLFLLLGLASAVSALEPAEVVLIVNKNVPASQKLADHYRKARDIPAANVIVLDLPKEEDISRADYDKRLATPLREALLTRKEKVKCLCSMYGVPLRVGGVSPSAEEKEILPVVERGIREADAQIKKLQEEAKGNEAAKKDIEREREKMASLVQRRNRLNHAESQASVDSELMLLWWDRYELARWQANLNHWLIPEEQRVKKPLVLLTSRLDGPSPAIVERMIDDAIAVEKVGLKGKVYVDARGNRFDPTSDRTGTGYGSYDESMREMAALLKDSMEVTLDDRDPVFVAGSCPDTALYCGWYSHAKFVDSCQFVRGAVAWHLASSEAVSLRRPGTTYWCPNILAKGACATLGPVAEPYTIGFPKPAEFFGFLATGKYTLAECYGRTVYFASWMGTLIGDPLYNPFKKSAKLEEKDVLASPKNSRPPFSR
jgi:uncharacterized protein (TIGR03790 family)